MLHVDMDAFFAAVEVVRHPELKGRPVVVGGSGPRGVVAAASYEARAHGVHSAMPAVTARRLCPTAVFLPGDHAHYSEVSARVMAVFARFTPLVEPISLDEAFLDVSGARRLLGSPERIAREIRSEIHDTEGLTCSVGVARLKFLAKLASQAAKPRASPGGPRFGPGVVVVEPDRERDFLHPMAVQALWGVGPATLGRLERLGIATVGQLAETPLTALVTALGQASGRHLHALANLVDPRSVVPGQAVKSVSHEETFPRDLTDVETVRVELTRLADAVASRLRASGTVGRTIGIKVRYGDFHTVSRSSSLTEATDATHEITRVARSLLDGIDIGPGVRLLGVSVSQLGTGATRQLSFDELLAEPSGGAGGAGPARQSQMEAAVDEVRARFGSRAVGPASLIGPDGLRVARKGAQQWGPEARDQPDPGPTDRA
ncbi:MAG: DNA polymerase IV [Microthrixaceae bacterium]|nr:DNA polymerase IV [Microthrixaceae bacterium]